MLQRSNIFSDYFFTSLDIFIVFANPWYFPVLEVKSETLIIYMIIILNPTFEDTFLFDKLSFIFRIFTLELHFYHFFNRLELSHSLSWDKWKLFKLFTFWKLFIEYIDLHSLNLCCWLHKVYIELKALHILSIESFVLILNRHIEVIIMIIFPILHEKSSLPFYEISVAYERLIISCFIFVFQEIVQTPMSIDFGIFF